MTSPHMCTGQEKIKDQFRAINGALRAVQESQSGWTVADAALRKHLRKAILAMFLPKYKVIPLPLHDVLHISICTHAVYTR